MTDTPTHEALRQCRDALAVALDLAIEQQNNLTNTLGDRLPHRHAAAQRDTETVRAAFAAADAALSVQAEPASPPDVWMWTAKNGRVGVYLEDPAKFGIDTDSDGPHTWTKLWKAAPTPQPAAPVQAVPLTEEAVWKSDDIMAVNAAAALHMPTLMRLIRAIERAHNITGGSNG